MNGVELISCLVFFFFPFQEAHSLPPPAPLQEAHMDFLQNEAGGKKKSTL